MGLFSKLFGSSKSDKQKQEEQPVYFAKPDEKMQEATANAISTFKYFWRELYWEHRRIIGAHGFAMLKVPFTQQNANQEVIVEHMWINNIYFDGDEITGELINDPHNLTNVAKGAKVKRSVDEITDWMISMSGKTYGGFTIQAMRSAMSSQERESHDKAWGLDFGDPDDILLVYKQKENPENLSDHPMDKNMAPKVREHFEQNPGDINNKDANGLTMLHLDAIAGNRSNIEILLEHGADKSLKSKSGKTAVEYAQTMGWDHILELLA